MARQFPLPYAIVPLFSFSKPGTLDGLKKKYNFKNFILDCKTRDTKLKAARIQAQELFQYISKDKDYYDQVTSEEPIAFRRSDDRGKAKNKDFQTELKRIWQIKETSSDTYQVKCNITGIVLNVKVRESKKEEKNEDDDTDDQDKDSVAKTFKNVEWDHRIPYSRQGPTKVWNFQPLSKFVNQTKKYLCLECTNNCYGCVLAFPEKNSSIRNAKLPLLVRNIFGKSKRGYLKDKKGFLEEFEEKFKKCSGIIASGKCTISMKAKCDKCKEVET